MITLTCAPLILRIFVIALGTMLVGSAQAQIESKPVTTITEALNLALAPDSEQPLAEDVRLQRLIGTYVSNARRWEFEFRDEETVHRIRVDSNAAVKRSKRYDARGAASEFWSGILPARQLSGLDDLVAEAKRIVTEAGFKPAGPMLVKYQVSGPRAEKRERLEVFFDIEEDEMARRVVFIDGKYDQLTRARLLKIQIPKIDVP